MNSSRSFCSCSTEAYIFFTQGNAVELTEDCLVKPFGVTIGSGMLRPGEAMPDIVSVTGLLELVIGPGEVVVNPFPLSCSNL